jgi:hypothetical protein
MLGSTRLNTAKENEITIWEPNGAGDGVRTRDINLGKVALYQLSYSRLERGYSTFSDEFVPKSIHVIATLDLTENAPAREAVGRPVSGRVGRDKPRTCSNLNKNKISLLKGGAYVRL